MGNKKTILIGIIVIVVIAFFFFLFRGQDNKVSLEEQNSSLEAETLIPETSNLEWRDVELKDVKTQEIFKISDFDKPIVLESFAVWCPTCKQQQDEIKKLIEQGDDSIHISINTDPNEDENNVIDHMERYGYDWKFVVFPSEATQELINEFGTTVVNAPRAPVILICPGQPGKLLKNGVKSVAELKAEIDAC